MHKLARLRAMPSDALAHPFASTLEVLRDLLLFDPADDPVRPLLEMREAPDHFELHARIPDLRAEELELVADVDHLSFEADSRRASRRCQLFGPKTRELRLSRRYSFNVPVEVERARADLRDGELHVVLPKAHATVHGRPRQAAADTVTPGRPTRLAIHEEMRRSSGSTLGLVHPTEL